MQDLVIIQKQKGDDFIIKSAFHRQAYSKAPQEVVGKDLIVRVTQAHKRVVGRKPMTTSEMCTPKGF